MTIQFLEMTDAEMAVVVRRKKVRAELGRVQKSAETKAKTYREPVGITLSTLDLSKKGRYFLDVPIITGDEGFASTVVLPHESVQ